MLDAGLELSEKARYFDPAKQSIITEYGVVGFVDEVVLVSERDFAVLEHRKIEASHAPMEVETRVRKYDKDFFHFDPVFDSNILSTRTRVNNIFSLILTQGDAERN